jgi:hypothetical protein
MCLVIDPCSIPSVFNPQAQNHSDFRAILRWVTKSSGRVVYGGSKYKRELSKMTRYLGIINELARAGRVVELDGGDVDRVAASLKKKINDRRFNDEHLVAILIVSKCRVICSDDKQAYPYLKRSDLYSGTHRPKIYRSGAHSSMCCAKNIAAICQ